jgi:DHA1 family tetracycline resistance protein-like MFS transporter
MNSSKQKPPMKTPSPRLAVFLIVLLDVMGFGLIIPSQPFLAKSFGASAATVTLLGTIYSLMQFLVAPVWGNLSDRLGRRPILLCTIAMTLAGHATFAASSSLAMLFLARALAGTGAGNIATAQAVLADTNVASERSRAMALIGAAFGLGFIFGPAIGGIVFHFDHRAPAAFGALLALVNFIFVALFLPETRNRTEHNRQHTRPSLRELFALGPQLPYLISTTLLFITAFALMEQSVGLFIETHWVNQNSPAALEEATSLTSLFLVVVGISATLVQGFLVRKWLRRHSETKLLRLGLVVITASLIAIPALGWSGSFYLFLISGATLALGSGMFNPSMAGLVSLASPESKQGFGLAVNQSAAALGRIIGPTTAGALFAIHPNAPFLVAAGLAVVALGVSGKVVKGEN